MNKILRLITTWVAISFFPGLVLASERILISPLKVSYEVVKLQGKVKTFRNDTIRHDKKECKINGNLISLDPSGSKAAILRSMASSVKGAADDQALRRYLLSICDFDSGRDIVTLEDAYFLTFSGNGNAVAYAASYPDRYQGYAPPKGYQPGAWFVNLDNKSKNTIDCLGVEPIDINWSDHDGNIYIAGYDKVVQYDVAKRASKIVPYKGIYFSKDGKYYANMPTENSLSGIYRTSDNREMVEWEKMVVDSGKSRLLNLVFVSKGLDAFIFYFGVTSGGINNVIFGLRQGKVIGQFEGLVVGTNADGTLVQVYPMKKDGSGGYDMSRIEIIDLTKFKK